MLQDLCVRDVRAHAFSKELTKVSTTLRETLAVGSCGPWLRPVQELAKQRYSMEARQRAAILAIVIAGVATKFQLGPWGYSGSASCALCGGLDTAHHRLAECPAPEAV